MMLYKVLVVAVLAFTSSQLVEARKTAQRSLIADLSEDIVKPIATNVLNKGLNLILPSDYNFDGEIDTYIGFAVNIGNTVNAMFKTSIDMLKMAKTKNRAPGALFNPRLYNSALSMGKYGVTLGKHLLHLVTSLFKTAKNGVIYIINRGATFIPRKISSFVFGN